MLNDANIFSDTGIAFKNKSDDELRKAYWLFKIIGNNLLTRLAPGLTKFAINARLPVRRLIKKTIFRQFCGGETIDDCKRTIDNLHAFHVGTILDYSVEGENNEESFDKTCAEILQTITYAENNPAVPFTVFKPSGLGSIDLMTKVAAHQPLNDDETIGFNKMINRMEKVCAEAARRNVRILIDAEHSWIQNVIDDFSFRSMMEYNKKRAVVYHTYQLYRSDKLADLSKDIDRAKRDKFILGAKLVRGAYLEIEKERALRMGYPAPVYETKELTDKAFNDALTLCVNNYEQVSFVAGTHNETSCIHLIDEMKIRRIDPSHPSIYFAQLYGMSDHITFNLAHQGYNTAKYLPFGAVKEVMPYLFRRAKENTSVAGQVGRELRLIAGEIARRKKSGKWFT